MDFSGLVGQFPVNRPLTDLDRQYQLRQGTRLALEPRDQLAVIRMNSTFLESVDKWFGWKGFTTAFVLTILLIFLPTFGYIAADATLKAAGVVATDESRGVLAMVGLGFGTVLGLMGWGLLVLLKKESFALTHYPLRFNRKSGMVHYFRPNGDIGSVRWDEVFFTVVRASSQWGVRGHVLAADRQTVLDTFALGHTGSINSHAPDAQGQYDAPDYVRAHWEFIRRYMEEGPQEASHTVQFCMPIAERKETLKGGLERVFANFGSASTGFLLAVSPFCLWVVLGRWLAMATCRIPRWPAGIEAACRIEPNDPYAIKGDASGGRTPDAVRA